MFSSGTLSKVYVAGSLRNTAGGFEFLLKNTIESGTISTIRKLELDGAALDLQQVTLKTPQASQIAAEITSSSPLRLYFSDECRVSVNGANLSPSAHKLLLVISVFEAGVLSLPIEDSPSAA